MDPVLSKKMWGGGGGVVLAQQMGDLSHVCSKIIKSDKKKNIDTVCKDHIEG